MKVYPAMPEEDFAGLIASLQRHGQPELLIDEYLRTHDPSISQRGLMAAQVASIRPKILLGKRIAALFKVRDDLMRYGKIVLRDGTPEEIAAVRKGEAALSTVWRSIERTGQGDARPLQSRAEGKRIHRESMQRQAQVWHNLRDGLENLGSLPRPADVLPLALKFNRMTQGAVERRLVSVVNWLTEFCDAWHAASEQDRAREGHAGNGADTPGTQQDEPADQRFACEADRPTDH